MCVACSRITGVVRGYSFGGCSVGNYRPGPGLIAGGTALRGWYRVAAAKMDLKLAQCPETKTPETEKSNPRADVGCHLLTSHSELAFVPVEARQPPSAKQGCH
jgi:hypothetical protein